MRVGLLAIRNGPQELLVCWILPCLLNCKLLEAAKGRVDSLVLPLLLGPLHLFSFESVEHEELEAGPVSDQFVGSAVFNIRLFVIKSLE